MKTSAETIVKVGVGLAQRLFSRVMMALCVPAPATITPQLAPLSRKSRAPTALIMAVATFAVAATSLFAPRTAEARDTFMAAVVTNNFPNSAQAYLCGNCHVAWAANGPAYASRIDWVMFNGVVTNTTSLTSPTYAMDSDNDGRSNLQELQASELAGNTRPAQSPASPNVANNWNWQLPDVDGDGCSHYFSRFTEVGTYEDTGGVANASVVGTGTSNSYLRFNPRGWDMDDNDAAQGCNPTTWTNTVIDVTSGTSTDNLRPGKVNTFSGAGLVQGAIPLKWVPVGDDGDGLPGSTTGGKAHSYEIRYTTSAFATGVAGRNPRSPADWEIMHNIKEPDQIDSGLWGVESDPDSLMQALYEPRPDVPTSAIQTCNALGTTCTAGASYDIKTRGTTQTANVIANGPTYWVAMWVHDGVTRLGAGGTLTTPVSVTEQATLSNIIAVTAGTAGAAISSFSPATIPTGQTGVTITVQGFGLTTAGNANQMVLTNTAGTVVSTATVAAATAVAPATTAVTGTFNTTGLAAGKYNLELRTSAAVTKAAWVEAVSATAPTPTLTSITPNTFGQGAVNKIIQFNGSNLTNGSATFSGTGITPNPVPLTGTASPWTATISASPTATSGNVSVTVSGSPPTASVAYTVTAAPSHNCAPPGGTVGVAYNYTCTASGGVVTTGYTWDVTMPAGLSWAASGTNNATLTITGMPTTAGTFGGTIRVTDNNSGSFVTTPSIVIAKGSQTITLTCSPLTILTTQASTCSATASTGLPVTLSSLTTAVCTISGGTVTPVTSGTCTIAGNQAGDANYNAAPQATQNITINKAPQTITLTCSPLSIPGGTTSSCTATSTSGLTVSLVSNTTSVCTVSGAASPYTVTGAAVTANSTCTVAANQTGNAIYLAATQVTQNITVTPAPGVIHNCPPTLPAATYGVAYSYSCTASGTGTLPYVWTVTGFPAAGLTHATGGTNNNTLTISGTPTSATTLSPTIAVRDSATPTPSTYGPTNHTLVIAKANQTITLTCSPLTILTTQTSTCSATASSGLPVTLSSLTTGVCTISGGTVTPVTGGICTIAGNQAGNANYNAAPQATQNITVNMTPQTITLSCTPLTVGVGGTSSCTATSSSGLPVSLISQTATVCSVSGTASPYTVTGNAAGTCTVAANQAGNATYSAAPQVTQNISVGKLNQTITLTCSPLSILIGGTSSCTATSDSGLPVSLVSQTATVCSVTGTASPYTVTGDAAGTCTVAANQAGNATYNPATQATQNITVADSRPDLIMDAVTKTDTSVHVGKSFPVANAVRNQGAGSAGNSYVKFYLSVDATVTTADIVMTGSRYVVALPGNAVSTTVSTTVTVPKTVSPGTYYVGACADVPSMVVESNETNNCMAATGTTPATITVIRNVDLVMTMVSTPTTSVSVGKTMIIDSTETNQGTTDMTVGSNYVKFYLSLDTVITTSDVAIVAKRFVAALPAGGSSTGPTTVTVPKGMVPGVYYVGACADGTYVQVETIETNNCLASTATVTITRNVQLKMTAVSTAATTASVASAISVDSTEFNEGPTDMTVASNYVKFYLSLDATITAADIAITTPRFVAALASGASSAGSTTVTVPKTMIPGDYYLGACADSTNAQPETNETDNCLASTATIAITRSVDLVMTTVSKTATSVGAGEVFSIDNVETNQGTTPMTVPANNVKFYLSADTTCTVGDIALTGSRFVTALAAGASSPLATTAVTVPKSVAPGTFTVCACADATNQQPETIENNNCMAATGTINVIRQVDLVVTAVSTVATTVPVNGTFTIDSTVKNQGTTIMTAGSTLVKFYLSTDATINSSDKLLTGLRFVTPSLAAGASSSGSTTVTVPTTGVAPGTYYIGAIVDPSNTQPEINELNNSLAGMTITVTP